jgi:hypothetical protein
MLRRAAPYDSPTALQERALVRWTLLACALLMLALAAPALAGLVYSADDLGAFHYPLRHFYAQCLARGQAFDWAPGLFCGCYLTGDGQIGGYHPLHWLLYRCLPLPVAFNLELLFSYPVMLAGMYVFLRRQLVRRDAALLGGMFFTFGGFNLLHFVHPNAIAVIAHLPWLLWCVDIAWRDTGRRRALATAGIALCSASQLLLGYPQYVWFTLLAVAAWMSYLGVATRNGGAALNRVVRSVRIVIALGVGGMIGAVQLLPTFDALSHSQRAAVDSGIGLIGPLHPGNLLQLVGPYLFRDRVADSDNTHEFGIYAGAVPLLLSVYVFTRRHELGHWRSFALAAAALGVLSIVLALGHFGGVYPLLSRLPVIGRFRLPARHIVLFQFALASVAAVGFLQLGRQAIAASPAPWSHLKPLWKVVALAVVIAAVCPFVFAADRVSNWPLVLAGPLLIGAAALAITLAARQVRGGLVAVILLAACDQGLYGLSYAAWVGAREPHPRNVPALPSRSTAVPGRLLIQVPGGPRLWQEPNTLLLADRRLVDGYAGLEPANRLDYRRLSALRAANCALVSRLAAEGQIEGLHPFDDAWLAVPDPLPRFLLATSAAVSDDPQLRLDGVDLGSTALVDESAGALSGPAGTIAVLCDQPGEIRLRAIVPGRQLLVVSERYHPGWQATVDGRRVNLLRLNGDFIGCVVEPGDQTCSFRFQPASLRWGRWLTLAGAAALVSWLALSLTCIRPPQEGREP